MKNIILMFSALCFTTVAYANHEVPKPDPIDNSITNTNKALANANVKSKSIAISKGGSVKNSGNSKNYNKNVAVGGVVRGSGNSRVNVSTKLRNKNNLNQSQSQDTDQANAQSVTVEGDSEEFEAQRRNPVNTAYAAPLISSNDTCMGSSSVGGQGITFGFSVATTWRDGDCVRRKDARFLSNAKRNNIALALMCEKDSVRRAVELAGTREERTMCGLDNPPVVTTNVITPTPVVNKFKGTRAVGILGK